MKKSFLFSFFIFLLICILTCSCEKNSSPPSENFNLNTQYLASIQIENFESKGEFFFDEEKKLHLLHADPTSPLFGMEEIFDQDKIKTIFDHLEYEKTFSRHGTAILKCIFDVIQTENGKTEIENGLRVKKYSGEDFCFTLSSSKENPKAKTISGNGWNSKFNITFLPKA